MSTSTERERQLRCEICGGTQPPDRTAASEGWTECRFCGGISTIPGAGISITEAPGQRVAEIARPGVIEIVVRAGALGDAATPVLLLIVFDMFAGRIVAGIRTGHPFSALAVGVPLYLAALIFATRKFRAARREQHLRIGDDGSLTLHHQIGGRRIDRLRTRLPLLRARKERELEHPQLVLSRDERDLGRLYFESAMDLDWVMPRLYSATKATRRVELADRLRCDGCGGFIGTRDRLRHEGTLECPHCRTGLVYTRGGLHLGPLELRVAPAIEEACDASAWPQRESVPEERFRFAPEPLRPRHGIGMVFAAGLVALLLWPIPWLIGMTASFPIGALAVVALILVILGTLVKSILDDRLVHLELEVRTEGIEVSRRILGRRLARVRFPLARLVGVDASLAPGRILLKLRGATRELELGLPIRGDETTASVRKLLASLRSSADRIGRGFASPDAGASVEPDCAPSTINTP